MVIASILLWDKYICHCISNLICVQTLTLKNNFKKRCGFCLYTLVLWLFVHPNNVFFLPKDWWTFFILFLSNSHVHNGCSLYLDRLILIKRSKVATFQNFNVSSSQDIFVFTKMSYFCLFEFIPLSYFIYCCYTWNFDSDITT